MNRKRSDWWIPEEARGLLGSLFLAPGMVAVAMLAGMLLPDLEALRRADVTKLYLTGLGAGVAGVVLLFFARLPLYRERRFRTFGPQALDRFHQRLYWLAWLAVLASAGLFLAVWVRAK